MANPEGPGANGPDAPGGGKKPRRPSGRMASFREADAAKADQPPPAPAATPDTRFAKVVIQSGLASPDAVKTSIQTLSQAHALGLKKTLAEVMLDKGILTENQARAVKAAASKGDEGGLLAGYQLLEKIGEGGMGTVFKARQVSLDRLVAIKILPERLAENKEFLDRFEREARTAAKLDHQNIVRAIDVGVASGKRYFVMEYVRGKTVGQILDEEGRIPEDRALQITIQVARGLECAWRNNLVHRDVKPDNIILTTDGVAKLADLGLAREISSPEDTRVTRAGAAVGTPQYMSPEQATAQEVDIRSDVYSLGATFYHMVAGQPPFSGKDVMEVIAARFQGRLTPVSEKNPKVSPEVASIISTMMRRDPKERYPDPRVLLHDLLLVAGGQRPEFANPSRTAQLRAIEAARAMKSDTAFYYAKPKRTRLVALLVSLGVTAGVAALAWALVLMRPGKTEMEAAFRRAQLEDLPSAEQVQAACDEVNALVEAGEFEKAMGLAARLASKLAGGPGAEKLQELRLDASRRLDEKRLREAEERRYSSLVSEAKRELGSGDYSTALALLAQARGVKSTGEVKKLIEKARRMQFFERGEDSERKEDIAKAIGLYKRALAIEDEPELRARVEELERRRSLDELRAEADALRAAGKWGEARSRYEKALEVALGDERERLQAKVAECDEELSFLDLIKMAEEAGGAVAWEKALQLAEKALSMKPEDPRALELEARAKKALGPEKLIRNSIGMELVLVPAGEFTMGSKNGDPDEAPVREIHLDAYYIGKYEVTNAQFERFSPAHRDKRKEFSLGDDMPVVAVTWDEATAFCRWLSRREGVEYRLPTEAEWEKAARGTDRRAYPWGKEEPDEGGEWRCNFAPTRAREDWRRDGFEFASPVGSFPKGASPFGCFDAAGNVWEWCLDWYHESWYNVPEDRNPKGPGKGTERVIRGGSFTSGAGTVRCTNRAAKAPNFYEASLGFRCVWAVGPRGESNASKTEGEK